MSLVGIDPKTRRVLVRSHDGFAWAPSAGVLSRFRGFGIVVAVIAHDNPDDLDSAAEQYAHYRLEVGGKEQDGG